MSEQWLIAIGFLLFLRVLLLLSSGVHLTFSIAMLIIAGIDHYILLYSVQQVHLYILTGAQHARLG